MELTGFYVLYFVTENHGMQGKMGRFTILRKKRRGRNYKKRERERKQEKEGEIGRKEGKKKREGKSSKKE